MKGNYKDILNKITGDTPLETVAAYCDTVKDLELLIANVKPANTAIRLPACLVREGEELLKSVAPNKITAAFIQKNLNISYPQAAALCDRLKKRRI